MSSTALTDPLSFTTTVHDNLSPACLVEQALKRGEGVLAHNGALAVDTGERTGRSPKDKFLEDTPGVHDNIDWGAVNKPITPENFTRLEALAHEHLDRQPALYRFDGYCGADARHRLRVTAITEFAWHALFARTLFIDDEGACDEDGDWTILNASTLRLHDPAAYGVEGPVAIVQSLEQKKVIIIGTEYAGEMKKGIFYAMNYDMPDADVFPMHCSANVAADDPDNVALFFGLSGTGKTTLSADPDRPLIGDDEHGWSDEGVFNFEGGCYAKCIKLTEEGEPQIWNAIRFGSVLENTDMHPATRVPDYDSALKTENTRVTYPVDFIPGAVVPSMGGHPKNVIFLTADAFGVLPPVAKLTPAQAMYYFVNGYTSKLAGTEAGITEPTPNFSPCFGGPFLPRPAMVYARWLAKRVEEHGADVWLLNTGWTGGPYGTGERFKLGWTRAFVSAILDGSLREATWTPDPVFGLLTPDACAGVPDEVLVPRNTWPVSEDWDTAAADLAARFRTNAANYELDDDILQAGPQG